MTSPDFHACRGLDAGFAQPADTLAWASAPVATVARRTAMLAVAATLTGWSSHSLSAKPKSASPAGVAAGDGTPSIAGQVPGGVARLSLGPSAQPPLASAGPQRLLVVGDPTDWIAVVGIPLSAKPGSARISVQSAAGAPARELTYAVAAKRYAEQRLKVAAGKVDLSATDLARAERERAHQAVVVATFSDIVPVTLAMQPPVPGPRSSSFGLRRVFNGQARNPHSGMDIAAPTGTPVRAPLAGRVIDVGDYFFSGGAVWLDHGGGLLTLYAHLSAVDVAVGMPSPLASRSARSAPPGASLARTCTGA